jgi:hypothetical protein
LWIRHRRDDLDIGEINKVKYFFHRLLSKRLKYELKLFKLSKSNIVPLFLVRKPKKNFIASKTFYGIKIDRLFYKLQNGKKPAIWHEKYHQRMLTNIKLFTWLPIKRILYKKDRKFSIFKLEEFDADKFALRKTEKESTLVMLQKIQEMENQGLVKSNLKDHPTIKERIARIQSLIIK